MRSMIIHMSRSTARRPNVERLLRDLPNAEVIEAADGQEPKDIADLTVRPGNLHRPSYPFSLRPAEIGVFQSHRRCWRALLDSGDDFALIVEDDLAVDPARLTEALELIHAHAHPNMYVRLPVKDREKPGHTLATQGACALIKPKVIGLQCIAQVVGRGAAERLLQASDTIDRPVDTWLQMHWVTGQPIHAALPNGNREIAGEIGGSTIQTKIRASGKLAREWKRFVYRAQVALRPQKP
ncbi:glycosyltransferase family 25 protein [Thalassococcus sp. S3]|uniref:glycosyltransferase family 25 protein n=1 Tax=Thalassococcus sp. S3 TaxID=2017482 RepID=UPI0010246F46|nr:glycosyltransferase family 25 protein [Thalassococcus sp. S3]QBF33759.1 glycosyl transferase family 25 [Thalassococcus sp. S3]